MRTNTGLVCLLILPGGNCETFYFYVINSLKLGHDTLPSPSPRSPTGAEVLEQPPRGSEAPSITYVY